MGSIGDGIGVVGLGRLGIGNVGGGLVTGSMGLGTDGLGMGDMPPLLDLLKFNNGVGMIIS